MPSSSTTTNSDLCTQWVQLSDDELTKNNVENILKPIHDDYWVVAACVDRILNDATVQRSLLDLGLQRTEPALGRSKAVFDQARYDIDDEESAAAGEGLRTEEERRHAALVAHFRQEPADAQLCRMRDVLLNRLDRLNTFVEMCKDIPQKQDEDNIDDEWADDPWGDDAAGSTGSVQSYHPPLPLSTFLTDDLLDIAYILAAQENLGALRILLERHGSCLWPHRLTILNHVPEHILPAQYRDMLPIYDLTTFTERKPEDKSWRTEVDFSQDPSTRAALTESGVALIAEAIPESHNGLPLYPRLLSSSELASWYRERTNTIISSTGMIDAALHLVQYGASQGLPGLDELGEDLSLLVRLVYDSHSPERDADDEWTLTRWMSMDPASVVHAYLAHSTPKTIARDIRRLVVPYLFVVESRAERAGRPDPSLSTRLLYDYVLAAPLDVVAAIFEASKPTLPPAERLIRDDEDIVRLALSCLYGSDSLDQWSTMSRIFECLPAWNTENLDEDEADEADTTIASLGAFVKPTTSRPRCTPSDLLIFFRPLSSSSLSHALDVLDVHLESGEILSRWGVPAPLSWFLQSNIDIKEQRAWANRLARRADASEDKLETQDDWEWLLEDMLKLSGSGESGSRSAFCLLTKDDIVRIFFSGLLSTGRFEIAKRLLRSSNQALALEPGIIEDICLACSQEFYENASSGNYHFGDMKLAYDCLDVASPSDRITKEKEFIEATSRLCSFNLMSRPGIPISPIEIRLTKDRLALVSQLLSSNNDAYKHTQVILDLVHKLGFRGDVVAEVKTLAMLSETALQVNDFDRAYETSERMVEVTLKLRSSTLLSIEDVKVQEASEVCWVTCFQLGRHPEFPGAQRKLTLLGRAMELCPPDKLVDVLNAFHNLEDEAIEERRSEIQSHRVDARTTAPQKYSRQSSDAVSSLASHLQHLRMPDLHMPHSPLSGAPDAAALANKAFKNVTANFPFSMGSRGRTFGSDDHTRSHSGSRTRTEGPDVSAQASKVLQKGIGWLLGADDDL